jgi:hypothetical protein
MTDNKFKRSLVWDKDNSTFIQRIVFYHNQREMMGYSKKINFHERNDKDALLINWILRMYRDGYLDPKNTRIDSIEYIEYYRNTKPHPTLIFRLFYKYPEWNPEFLGNIRLVNFINRFYDMVDKGKTVDEICKALYVSNYSKAVDPLDLSTKRFMNERDLTNYCSELITKNKAEQGAVTNFFHKYKEKFLSK